MKLFVDSVGGLDNNLRAQTALAITTSFPDSEPDSEDNVDPVKIAAKGSIDYTDVLDNTSMYLLYVYKCTGAVAGCIAGGRTAAVAGLPALAFFGVGDVSEGVIGTAGCAVGGFAGYYGGKVYGPTR